MRRLLLWLLVIVGLAGLWAWLQNPERLTLDGGARARAPMQFATLSDGVTAFRLEGPTSAPLVVLVHGFSYPSSLWIDTALALQAAGFRTLRYDLYGRGWSDRPGGPYDLPRFRRQLDELLALLAPGLPVQLVGLSMGGLIAADYAQAHPQRIDRLILMAPFNTAVDVGPLALPGIGDLLAHLAYFPRQPGLQRANFTDARLHTRYLPGFEAQLAYRGYRRAILSTLREIIVRDPTPVYRQLAAEPPPTLLLWGRDDRVVPLAEAPALLQQIGPAASLQVIDAAGHLPQLEKPAATHEAMRRFLAPALPGGN